MRVHARCNPRRIRRCEVDVQDREQVDSRDQVEERERKKTKQGSNQRTLKHVTSWMACGWSECARCDTLSHNAVCAQGESVEKVSCEVDLSAPSVGYSESLSTVNETNCN